MRIPKREFTVENLQVYAEWVADKFRQQDLMRDGWSSGHVVEYSSHPNWDYSNINEVAVIYDVQLLCRWGLDEEGYRQEWYEYLNYADANDWYREYDNNFGVKGIKLVYSNDEPEKETTVFGTKV